MRRPISRKARAPKGARVVCECSLPSDQRQATIGVYTSTPGFDLSPYVNPEHLGLISRDRPIMHKPMFTTLRPENPAHTFEFIAGEDQFVQIMQDVDIAKDPSAKAKVKVHGKTASSLRWLFRDALRAVRDRYGEIYRHYF